MDFRKHRKSISRAALSAEHWSDALEAIGSDFASASGVFWSYDHAGDEFLRNPIVMWGEDVAEEAVRFAEVCGEPEPWVTGALEQGLLSRNVVVRGEDLATRRQWETGPWADFETEFGARRLLSLNKTDPTGQPRLGISFLRPLSAPAFEMETVRALSQLAEDFDMALGVMRDYAVAEAKASHLESMLDGLDEAAFLLTPRAQIVWMNAAAEAELSRSDPVFASQGRLALRSHQADRFARTCHEAADGQARVMSLTDRSGRHVRLRFAPVTRKEHSLVAFFLQHVVAGRRAELIDTFDLTEAECDVAGLLSAGLTPSQIARRRGTAISTVRSQLASVFMKLDAANQVQAVAALKPFFS